MNKDEYDRLNLPINKRYKNVHELRKDGRAFGYMWLGIEMLFCGGWVLANYVGATIENAKGDEWAWLQGVLVGGAFILHTILVYVTGTSTTNKYRDDERLFELLEKDKKEKKGK